MMMEDEIEWGPQINQPAGGWPNGECPIPGYKPGEYQICENSEGDFYQPTALTTEQVSWKYVLSYRVRADLMHRVQPAATDVVERMAAEYYARGFGLRCRVVDYLNGLEPKETLRASFAEWESASGTKFLLPPTAAPKPAAPAEPAEPDVVEKMAEALDELLNYSGGADSALEDEYVVDRATAALAAYAASKEAGR